MQTLPHLFPDLYRLLGCACEQHKEPPQRTCVTGTSECSRVGGPVGSGQDPTSQNIWPVCRYGLGAALGIGKGRTDEAVSSVKVNLPEEGESEEKMALGFASRGKLQVSKGGVQRPR